MVEPIVEAAPHSRIRGFKNDFDDVTADVLLLEGEVHLHRKPGFMRFTTMAGRNRYAELVLEGVQVTQQVRTLAAKISDRMAETNGGRQWMGAHMRRGDCESWLALPIAFCSDLADYRSLRLQSRNKGLGHGTNSCSSFGTNQAQAS